MTNKPLSSLQQLSKSALIELVEDLQNNKSLKNIDNKTLFNSNNTLTNTFSVMNEGFICLDENDEFVFINKKGQELLNKDFNSLIGKNIWQQFKLKKGNLLFDNYYKAKKLQKPITFENYSKISKKWFKNRIIPSNLNVSIFYEDITEIKVSEKNKKDAFEILNNSPSVAFLWKNEKNWPVEYVSKNVKNIFGYSYDEFVSEKITYEELIHPEDLAQVREELENALNRKSNISFTHKPYRIITKSGQIRWVIEKNKLRFGQNSEITHFQGFIDDITERKKIEDTLYQISINTSSVVGEDYLNNITLELQKALNADFAFIGLLDTPGIIKTITLSKKGEIIDNITYDLKDTPCENVFGKESCSYSKNISHIFPKDQLLIDLEIEGYVGIPLFDNNSKPIGIVVALYNNENENENFSKSIIQIYTSRISAEIQNSKSKELLRTQKEENRILFDEAATPTWILDFSKLKIRFDDLKKKGVKNLGEIIITKKDILEFIHEINIIDINKKSLEFFTLLNEKESLDNLDNYLLQDSLPFIKNCIVDLFKGETSFEGEITVKNNHGKRISLIVEFSIPKIYQQNFNKVIFSLTNITERKKVEEIIFNNKQRLEEHLKNTPLASIVWDLNFNCLEWNKSAERIFGYTEKEALGKNAFDLIIPKHLKSKVGKLWNSLIFEEESNKLSIENIRKNGEKITCNWYNVIIKDISGNITSVASLVNDISLQIKSKKLLKQSEKKYKDIFNKSNDAVFILDENQNYLDCNKSALKMFGYTSKKSLLGQKPSNISPKLQPNGESSVILEKSHINTAIKKGSHKFIWLHKKPDGSLFPVEVSLTRIVDKNNKLSIHSVYREIADREKKDKIQKVLFNISNAALTIDNFYEFNSFIKSELGTIIDTTNFYIALYNKEQEFINTPFMVDELGVRTDFSAAKTLTSYVIKSKKSLLGTENQIKSLIKKGLVEWVGPPCKVWLGVPLKINNEVIGVIAVQSYDNESAYTNDDVAVLEFVSHNISVAIQRKKSEEKLKQALEKAKEADLLKTAFLANMSHEIRTPMNGIIGFSELLAEQNITEKDRHNYTKVVINSSKQLLSIVNDILDISQIEAGMVTINKCDFSINELLDNLFVFFNQKTTKQNINLSVSKSLTVPNDIISTDDIKLNQVLTNLIANAIKFTEKGSVEFGYKIINSEIQFFVNDTGIGIKKSEQAKVFDRFIQADINLTKKHRGNGLGLSICYKLVELLGGRIWLESEYTKGSSFFFTIPYNASTIQKPLTKPIEILLPTLNEIPLTILVAEDEEYNRLYLNEIFSKTNHTIIEAINGKQAIELSLKHSTIDLILMDIKMPILDGLEATKEIKKLRPNIPIIAVSAYAMESDISIALEAGCDDALTKPINRKKLITLINKYAVKTVRI